MKDRIIFLVGPTASGKSEAALFLAKKIGAEIISCDSMQVYKGMDIITSKTPKGHRRRIRHHLISIISPDKEYNVSRYYKDVSGTIKEIIKRGKTPLIVGGTGLYMSILIDGIFKSKPLNENIRERLFKEAEARGGSHLYSRLEDVDPVAASKIHPNDIKRIIRALEVFEATGSPISKLQRKRRGLSEVYNIKVFGLDVPRERLYERIESRVERMFADGLINEVRKLLKSKLSRTASYAIGIREIKGYLEGSYGLDEAKKLITRNTRLYAKRQLTWFRKDKRINWMELSAGEKPASIANRIWKKLY